MVVYGLNGTVSKVPSTIFDQIFFAQDGRMVLQAALDLNGQEVKNGSQKLFEGVIGGMEMGGSLDLKGFPLFGAKLSNDFDLNDKKVKDGSVVLFKMDNRKMLMGVPLDMGGFPIHQPKLGDDMNLNGYWLVGENGSGFEIDDNGRTKMHGNLDLNGHGIHEVLHFQGGNIMWQKSLDLNGKKSVE